jgi:hypothetical protein
VVALLEDQARVEIEATAIVPDSTIGDQGTVPT